MTVIVETNTGFVVGAQAFLLDDDTRLTAWAERHVRKDPDIAWILGNFVEAERANENGHIFPYADLVDAHATVAGKPLNMVHTPHYIVGAFAGSELQVPEGWDVATAADDDERPHMEALAGMWRQFFPEEYDLIQRAHKDGSLFFSMECQPQTVTCPVAECGMTAAFKGKTDESYCAHMNGVIAPKRLDKPHFNAGALIVPPIKPGWKRADITSVIRSAAEAADKLRSDLEAEMPHLSPAEWDAMMGIILLQANGNV